MSPKYKDEAVTLILTGQATKAETARKYGVSAALICRLMKEINT
jgi:transposase-like protein